MPILTPNTMKLIIPDIANIDQTSEPTVEGQGAADYLGNAIADGSQAINAMDGYPERPVTVDTSGERTTWRLDMALTKRRTYDAFVIDGQNLPVAYPLALRDMINILAHTSDAVGSATEVTYSKIMSGLLGKGRPYLKFDGINDYVAVADDADLSFVFVNRDIPCSLEAIFYMASATTEYDLIAKWGVVAANREYALYVSSAGKLIMTLEDGSVPIACLRTSDSALSVGWHHVIATYDGGGGATAADGIILYVDGSLVASTATNIGTYVAMENSTDALWFGRASNTYTDQHQSLSRLWNRELSAAEVLALYNGWTHTPIPVADQWGSATELMPNQVDRDFSGPSAWADVSYVSGGGAYDEGDDLTITAGTIHSYCTLPVASAPMTPGKRYRLFFDLANIVSTFRIEDFTGSQIFAASIISNGVRQFIEFTVDAGITGGLRIVSNTATSSGDFDNFALNEIGCVAEYSHDGIDKEAGKWEDASGNDLHGTITGCEYIDCPDDDERGFYLVEFTDVADNLYWFLQVVQNDGASNARADSYIGLAAPCKVYEFKIKAQDGYSAEFGYPGVMTRRTASGRNLAEQYYGRLDAFDITLAPMTEAEFGDFQEFQDLVSGARFPFYCIFNDNDADKVVRRLRMEGLPHVAFEAGSTKPFNVSLAMREDVDEV